MNIETPCLVIDIQKTKNNIKTFQAYGDRLGISVRPHIKTHRIAELAKLQVEMGACGITCAKLGEAEVMCENGIKDIFLAYPIIGENKIQRLLALNDKVRLISSVDSLEGAKALSDAAFTKGKTLELRLEIDTGLGRTGVKAEKAVALARMISKLPGLNISGIYTYKSAVLNGRPTEDFKAAAEEEEALMQKAAESLKAAGINISEISGGSSTTARYISSGVLTEMRFGTYIFADAKRVKSGEFSLDDCAACVHVTVVSTPDKNRAIVDGGIKAFGGDMKGGVPPLFLRGYGIVLGHPELILSSMTEEHGVLEAEGDTGLRVGQILRIVPNHICSVVNLYNYAYMQRENGELEKVPVDCRGLSY